MSSTINTSFAPSYAGGGGGKRGRDDDDGRDPDKPKPLDKGLGLVDFAPDGELRELVKTLLKLANLGTVPSGGLLTKSKNLKSLADRTSVVAGWLSALINASPTRKKIAFSELAEAFVHTARAISIAGLFDQLVALLVEEFTTRAVDAANGDDDDDEDDE